MTSTSDDPEVHTIKQRWWRFAAWVEYCCTCSFICCRAISLYCCLQIAR